MGNPSLTYESLNRQQREIRLICISPAELDVNTDIIECYMTQSSLDAYEPYRALSYVWGVGTETKTIQVNGYPFEVTTNLHEALLHIRNTPTSADRKGSTGRYVEDTSTCWVWIDALCINQADDVEKSWQVAQMADVYKNASEVLIWLGTPAESNSELAFSMLREVGTRACALGLNKIRDRSGWVDARNSEASTISEELPQGYTPLEKFFWTFVENTFADTDSSKNEFAALTDLLQRPWWNRMWVIQEATFARTASFACGSESITAEHFEAGLLFYSTALSIRTSWRHARFGDITKDEILEDHYNAYNNQSRPRKLATEVLLGLPPKSEGYRSALSLGNEDSAEFDKLHANGLFRPAVLDFRRHYFAGELKLDLYTILSRVCCEPERHEASDPRDMVFAVLGLVAGVSDAYQITPEYGKAAEMVYLEVAKAALLSGRFDLLSMCQGSKYPTLPSWVPDWSSSIQMPMHRSSNERVEFSPRLERPRIDSQPSGSSDWSAQKNEHELDSDISSPYIKFSEQTGYQQILTLKGITIAHRIIKCENDASEIDEVVLVTDEGNVEGFLTSLDVIYKSALETRSREEQRVFNMTEPVRYYLLASILLASLQWSQREQGIKIVSSATETMSPKWDPLLAQNSRQNLLSCLIALISKQEFRCFTTLQQAASRQGESFDEWMEADTTSIWKIVPKFSKMCVNVVKTGYKTWHDFESSAKREACFLLAVQAAAKTVKRGTLFVTPEGSIGVCPKTVEDGDTLVLFEGSAVPYVLRRVDDKYFKLIGEAYLDPTKFDAQARLDVCDDWEMISLV